MFFGKLITIFGGRSEERSSKDTVRERVTAAFTILCLGILFISFSIYNYFNGFAPSYTLTHAILIASCAFFKLVLAIYGIAKYSSLKRSSLFVSKLLNLTDAAISLSITQSALLSAKHIAQTYVYDAISGILTGSAIVIAALILLFSNAHIKKNK